MRTSPTSAIAMRLVASAKRRFAPANRCFAPGSRSLSQKCVPKLVFSPQMGQMYSIGWNISVDRAIPAVPGRKTEGEAPEVQFEDVGESVADTGRTIIGAVENERLPELMPAFFALLDHPGLDPGETIPEVFVRRVVADACRIDAER